MKSHRGELLSRLFPCPIGQFIQFFFVDLQSCLIALTRTSDLPSDWSMQILSMQTSTSYITQNSTKSQLAASENSGVTFTIQSVEQCQFLTAYTLQASFFTV